MLYTRKEMINLLMLWEEDYAKDNKDELDGKTPKQWVEDSFELYSAMNDEELLYQHMTILDGLYEEDDMEEMAIKSRERLIQEKERLWI